MTTLTVEVPALPQRILSSNAGKRSRRDPWSVANARGELKAEVMEALKAVMPLPSFERATADVTLRRSKRRPKLEDCPRCLERFLAGDHPSWGKDRCCCYRPDDVGNIGGDPLKPILDALVWMEVLPDDDMEHLLAVTLRIEAVAEVEDEGITVIVSEALRED